MRINQCRSTHKLLKLFNFTECKKFDIPIESKFILKLCKSDKKTKKPFRELIGCLMHLMLGSCIDICFTLKNFSRFQDKATDMIYNHLKKS